ncbi:BGTF surface domain-containing protein [Halorubrum sp. AD140]|uniref:BGTF surface domain-containing protein n=1 Tax=Halorubrum sp. AD140 TaxID=3050073 RepID=UPI002ACCB74A|nr:BGTF surface domain-containing protein [Halorubrum sp. AD140]MDZ5811067.1 BGTF surface domain-containing protein [Halorubrum sp. AD140]
MTSRVPPDDADRSDSASTDGSRGEWVDSGVERGDEAAERDARVGERARLATLGATLVAIAVLLALLGGAASGPAAAALDESDVAGGGETARAIETDAATGAGDAVSREVDGSFSRSTYNGTAGDPVEIRHVADASGNDTAYLLVGGNRLTDDGGTVGYVDVLKVDDGSTTINTRLLGTNESDVDSCSAPDVDCDLEFENEDGEVIAENLTELSDSVGATGAGGLARPPVPERYRLAITNGTFVVRDSGAVDPVKVAAESDLVLREPTFHDEVEVFTTADADVIADGDGGEAADGEGDETESLDDLRDHGVDRTAVTKGDRIVLGFESTGIWGALSHFAANRTGESGDESPIEAGTTVDHRVLVDLLEAEEGVSLRVRQTNPGRNKRPTELDLADADPDDVTLFLAEGEELDRGDADRAPGRFYLAIDTSDGGPFTDDVEPGDEFSAEFALEGTEGERYAFRDGGEPPAAFGAASETDDDLSEQYPYHGTDDGRVDAEATFSVRERYLRYDHVTDDGTLLVEADNGTITGTTSVLPETELSATTVRDTDETPNRTESELSIEDGNVSVDSGLAGAEPGTEASYRLYRGQSLQESRDVLVVENATDPDRLRLANGTTTNRTVTRGESLANLTAAVENTGQVRNREQLTLDVDDGAIVEERHVTVAPGASENETFAEVDADLEPGEYPYSLAIDGDRVNGTLIVEADPAVTRVDDANGTDGEANGSNDDANGSNDDANGSNDDANGSNDGETAEDDSTEDDSTEDDSTDEGSDEASTRGDDGETRDEEGSDQEGSDEAPPTLLPFGIGTRETFGGTVLVGATYLLGHWV